MQSDRETKKCQNMNTLRLVCLLIIMEQLYYFRSGPYIILGLHSNSLF